MFFPSLIIININFQWQDYEHQIIGVSKNQYCFNVQDRQDINNPAGLIP